MLSRNAHRRFRTINDKRWKSSISKAQPHDNDQFVHEPIDDSQSRPIYVAATKEHVGKTTTCLALISGLKKRFPRSVGYLKPVGQRHVPVFSQRMKKDIRVDKDVALIRDHFNLQHIDFGDMSPVLIPSGYTKDYIDGKISHDLQLNAIENAVENIRRENEVVLCEGKFSHRYCVDISFHSYVTFKFISGKGLGTVELDLLLVRAMPG